MNNIRTLQDFEKLRIVYKPAPKDPEKQICDLYGKMLFKGQHCVCIARAKRNYESLQANYKMYRDIRPRPQENIFGYPMFHSEPRNFRPG